VSACMGLHLHELRGIHSLGDHMLQVAWESSVFMIGKGRKVVDIGGGHCGVEQHGWEEQAMWTRNGLTERRKGESYHLGGKLLLPVSCRCRSDELDPHSGVRNIGVPASNNYESGVRLLLG
jgi:hypothetical protein